MAIQSEDLFAARTRSMTDPSFDPEATGVAKRQAVYDAVTELRRIVEVEQASVSPQRLARYERELASLQRIAHQLDLAGETSLPYMGPPFYEHFAHQPVEVRRLLILVDALGETGLGDSVGGIPSSHDLKAYHDIVGAAVNEGHIEAGEAPSFAEQIYEQALAAVLAYEKSGG